MVRHSTLAGLIADELTIGVINHQTVGVRLIPVVGKAAGEWAEFGGAPPAGARRARRGIHRAWRPGTRTDS